METIAKMRYSGGVLLGSLMLFLMTPLSIWAQVLPVPTMPEYSPVRVTKNGTVIEEGDAPAVRRNRPPQPRDEDVRERKPKTPHEQDATYPAIETRKPTEVNGPDIVEAPNPYSKDAASKMAPVATATPSTVVPDEPNTFELGLDGRYPENLLQGLIMDATRTDVMEAPMPNEVQAVSVSQNLLQGAQSLAGVTEEVDLPESFALEANYPNPFNPVTTIRFALPEASRVRIQVFDLLGREVALLVDGNLSAGRHEVVFDARGLASGHYIYRMNAGSFEQHRSMILMK